MKFSLVFLLVIFSIKLSDGALEAFLGKVYNNIIVSNDSNEEDSLVASSSSKQPGHSDGSSGGKSASGSGAGGPSQLGKDIVLQTNGPKAKIIVRKHKASHNKVGTGCQSSCGSNKHHEHHHHPHHPPEHHTPPPTQIHIQQVPVYIPVCPSAGHEVHMAPESIPHHNPHHHHQSSSSSLLEESFPVPSIVSPHHPHHSHPHPIPFVSRPPPYHILPPLHLLPQPSSPISTPPHHPFLPSILPPPLLKSRDPETSYDQEDRDSPEMIRKKHSRRPRRHYYSDHDLSGKSGGDNRDSLEEDYGTRRDEEDFNRRSFLHRFGYYDPFVQRYQHHHHRTFL